MVPLMEGNTALRQTTGLNIAPADVVEELLAFAMEFSRCRVGSDQDQLALLKRNQAEAHDYFRHGLALRLAEYVGEIDATVKAIYVCNWDEPAEEVEADPTTLTTPLSLIVWVSRKTAAIDSLLADLDDSLTRHYRELVAPQAEKLRSFLDVHVVDDQAVHDRFGCAALITSIRGRPTRVWGRTPAEG